jgi:hypothetical protein
MGQGNELQLLWMKFMVLGSIYRITGIGYGKADYHKQIMAKATSDNK